MSAPLPEEATPDCKAFGRALSQARLAAGLTQAELAREVSSSPAHISKLECGEVSPGARILVALEERFPPLMEIDVRSWGACWRLLTHEEKISFGARIRAAREARKITTLSFARRLQVVERTVQRWEEGQAQPQPRLLAKLRTLFPELRSAIEFLRPTSASGTRHPG